MVADEGMAPADWKATCCAAELTGSFVRRDRALHDVARQVARHLVIALFKRTRTRHPVDSNALRATLSARIRNLVVIDQQVSGMRLNVGAVPGLRVAVVDYAVLAKCIAVAAVDALAKALGIGAARLNEIARARRGISADTALRLARYFGTTPEFWLNLQASYALRMAQRKAGRAIERTVKPRQAA